MRWITDPAKMADALNVLLFGDPADEDARSAAREHAVNVLTEYRSNNGQIPVLERYGCPDSDLDVLLSYVDSMFAALAALRSGALVLDGSRDPETLERLAAGLTAVGHRLMPRVQGLLEALTNAHYEAGGSHGELAAALDEERSTVAKRSIRRKVSGPNRWEKWALGELEKAEHPARDLRPGWIMFDANDRRHQVQTVNVYSDGVVEIEVGGRGAFCYTAGDTVSAIPRRAPVQEATGTMHAEGRELQVTTYTRARRTRQAPAAS